MYTIYADDVLLYTPDVEELCLYDIVLTMEDNSAGTLIFRMTSSHPAFDSLKKLSTMIRVEDSRRVIWKGRIISDDRNIDNIKTIQCEGKMAFLNDSIFPEFEFSGAPDQLFGQIIENHNSQVGENQRFLIGDVTIKDNNDYIVRSSESALKTWKAVKEKCFQSALSGHLQIRYDADGDYIDWLEDYQEISSQSISFGKNIIDLLVNTSAAETYTAIRPQGAQSDGKRIDITSVNEGRDYIVDEERAAEYGVIYADPEESIWEDVTLPENLLRKARERLAAGIVLKKTIEVRAIDLHLTDEQIEVLRVCSYVRVVSVVHGIEAWYLLSKAEIHIDAPENTRYTLGAVKMALTDTNKAHQSHIVRAVERAIPTKVSQLENDGAFVNTQEVIKMLEESGMSAPVFRVKEDTEDSYILEIESAGAVTTTPNLKGSPGEPGKDGSPGRDGMSAFESAVKNGFTGSETEWIESLRGKQGEKGESGGDGAQGEPGTPGQSAYDAAVAQGFSGTVQEWLRSLQGEKGDPGRDGVVTIEGITGTEGDVLQYQDGQWRAAQIKISGNGSGGIYCFEIREDGHLWLLTDEQPEQSNFYIREDGHLIYQTGV